MGPVISGAGMILLSMIGQVHRLSDYWFTFFPGMLVFGLGMSLTVAPLTATVMEAAGRQYSGVASGVNNALSRVASVFANAVLGALAVVLFTGVVGRKVDGLGLDVRDRQAVMAETAKLGDAKVPEDVNWGASGADGGVGAQVAAVYREGFIEVYQVILRIAAGLAFTGALTVILFVKKGQK